MQIPAPGACPPSGSRVRRQQRQRRRAWLVLLAAHDGPLAQYIPARRRWDMLTTRLCCCHHRGRSACAGRTHRGQTHTAPIHGRLTQHLPTRRRWDMHATRLCRRRGSAACTGRTHRGQAHAAALGGRLTQHISSRRKGRARDPTCRHHRPQRLHQFRTQPLRMGTVLNLACATGRWPTPTKSARRRCRDRGSLAFSAHGDSLPLERPHPHQHRTHPPRVAALLCHGLRRGGRRPTPTKSARRRCRDRGSPAFSVPGDSTRLKRPRLKRPRLWPRLCRTHPA